jgi:acyl-CoA thioester hydrolase
MVFPAIRGEVLPAGAPCQDEGVARHVFPLKPRWSDLDAYNHVNNVTWLEYLQEARVDMLFVHAPARGAEQLAEGVLVVRAEIDYKRPMTFRQEPYPIEMWVSRLGSASFTIGYEIVDTDDAGKRSVYGVASTVLAPVDLATGRPRRLNEVERDVLGRFVEP